MPVLANLDVDWDLLDRQKKILDQFVDDEIVCEFDREMLRGISMLLDDIQFQASKQIPPEIVFPQLRA